MIYGIEIGRRALLSPTTPVLLFLFLSLYTFSHNERRLVMAPYVSLSIFEFCFVFLMELAG